MGITTIAYYVVARRWVGLVDCARPAARRVLPPDSFFTSNALKFFDGGFVPIVVALGLFFMMRVWKRGRALLGSYFRRAIRPLDGLLDGLRRGVYRTATDEERPVMRVPGVAGVSLPATRAAPRRSRDHVPPTTSACTTRCSWSLC